MKKNSKQLLEETQKFQVKNKEVHSQLKQNVQKAKDTLELIKKGEIDAFVIPEKDGLKIYTEKTADKIYRTLIEKMHEGAVTINKEGTILYCNSSFAGMVNQPLQKVIGSKIKQFIDYSSVGDFDTLLKKGWKGYSQKKVKIFSIEGKTMPVMMTVNPLVLHTDLILSFIITDLRWLTVEQELNEKKALEKQLEFEKKAINRVEDSNKRYNMMLMKSPFAFAVLKGNDMVITLANDSIKKMWGKGKDVEGKSLFQILPEIKDQGFPKILDKVYTTGIPFYGNEVPLQLKRKGVMENVYFNFVYQPYHEADETISGITVIAYEVTDFINKKRTEELIIANKELDFQNKEKEKRAAALSIANKELAFQIEEKEKKETELIAANIELTTFNYVSSHDLQEPLRKIKNFISVLLAEEEKKLSDEGKNHLHRMYQTANGMQTLIDDLLAYSRAKNTDRQFEKINLTLIVDEVKNEFAEVFQKKKATIKIGTLCETSVIQFQFHQVIQNLISNSLKFSKQKVAPHIKINSEIVHGSKLNNLKLSPEIDYCHIIYSDNGIGFDPQYNERIFELFQRLHSKEEYDGTGIGLAIVKRIVENHKGIITATGKLNKGARFDIYLPVT